MTVWSGCDESGNRVDKKAGGMKVAGHESTRETRGLQVGWQQLEVVADAEEAAAAADDTVQVRPVGDPVQKDAVDAFEFMLWAKELQRWTRAAGGRAGCMSLTGREVVVVVVDWKDAKAPAWSIVERLGGGGESGEQDIEDSLGDVPESDAIVQGRRDIQGLPAMPLGAH